MTEDMREENLELPEGKNKSETERYVEELINAIESELPKSANNYVTGIIVDDERNLLVIKNGKLYVGNESNAKEINEYIKYANTGYLINALYVLKQMLPSYKDMWSGKLEREARKTLNEII